MKRSRLRSAIALAIALLLGGCSKDQNSVSSDNFSDEESFSQSENSSVSSESGENSSDSSSSSSARELSADDQALRLILSEILEGAQEVDRIFHGIGADGARYHGLSADGHDYGDDFYEIPENTRTKPNGLFPVPQTREEVERLLRRYFTDRTIEYYMSSIHSGKFSTDADGSAIVNDTVYDDFVYAAFLEIDGKLYGRSEYDTYRTLSDVKLEDVIVTERTDTSIRFIYRGPNHKYTDGVLLYENGSWKFDFFGWRGFIPEMPNPADYTDEDKELQAILNELAPGRTICEWFWARTPDRFDFHIQPGGYDETYHLLPLEGSSDSGIDYPRSIDELEQLLLKYFTRNMVDNSFMSSACKGTMTENPDGSYTVTLDPQSGKYIKYPMFLEIDGKMYCVNTMRDLMPDIIRNTAQVIEKTDSRIKFKYIETAMGEYYEREGLIKLERGGWRLNMNERGYFETNV